ncbi:transposase, partial [uncultured Muribaculum sp.]|uniref:transposase n=1 Tax=uncultured Muribaculum sp. TaxID=1918613 RepID=UPI00263B3477
MKLQKIGDIQPTLPFTEYDFLKKYRESFAVSELGRIHAMLPLKEMADELASHFPKKNPQGNSPMFPPEGEVALMFLKPYTGLSDDGLVEMLNGSIHMQMFCGVLIDPSQPIKDGKIVSAIRNRLAFRLDIVKQQSVLYKKWDSLLKDKDLCMSDATCYESYLRYPTDIKLMWECCEWLYILLQKNCREVGERLPRSKYNDVSRDRLAYAKQRKPKKSATRRMQRRLLRLLGKLIGQWNNLCRQYAPLISLTAEQHKRIAAIREVHRQQTDHFNKKEVKHRIVSIDRPYIRPIVRGKENKRVEFGAKVNNIQIDGISFIEHHSFEAFNEGIRLKQCVEYQEKLTGVAVKRIGMDTIYANNENRRYCTEKGITTNFVRKGPRPKDESAEVSTARRIIGNLRATVMEGSFGNQKQHY